MTQHEDIKVAEEWVWDETGWGLGDGEKIPSSQWLCEANDCRDAFLAGIAYGRATKWIKCSEKMPEVGMTICYAYYLKETGLIRWCAGEVELDLDRLYIDTGLDMYDIKKGNYWFEIVLPKDN